MHIEVGALRTEFDLTDSEAKSISDAMRREVEAGGGKWFRPTGTNNRLHRVITQIWVQRKEQHGSGHGLKRKKLISAASVLLKKVLESNSSKGANEQQ